MRRQHPLRTTWLIVLSALLVAPPALAADAFSIAVIMDTQYLTEGPGTAPIYNSMLEWIVSNTASRNIIFTCQQGDIVQSGGTALSQWIIADAAWDIMDAAGLQYGVCPGNHDVAGRDDQRDPNQNLFLTYFGASRFTGKPTHIGHSPTGYNSFFIADTADGKLAFLFMDWEPSPGSFQWARDMLAAHRNVPTVFVAHAILYPIDSRPPGGWYGQEDQILNGAGLSGEGLNYWNQVIRDNPQIFLTLNGHFTGGHGARMVSTNSAGRWVQHIFCNCQGDWNGGNGMMRVMDFDTAAQTVSVFTFSSWVKRKIANGQPLQWYDIEAYTDVDNQFVLSMDFAERFRAPCGLPGDMNCDGLIGGADFALAGACMFGPGAAVAWECLTADIDEDGAVDLRDMALLQGATSL